MTLVGGGSTVSRCSKKHLLFIDVDRMLEDFLSLRPPAEPNTFGHLFAEGCFCPDFGIMSTIQFSMRINASHIQAHDMR